MGAFEFFAQSLVKDIVGRHGRRTRYIRQQGSMSGVHPLFGSFDLFSRGHNDLSFRRGRVLCLASFLQRRLPVQGHCEWRRGLRRRSLEQETFAV